jgi:hypothetical protein
MMFRSPGESVEQSKCNLVKLKSKPIFVLQVVHGKLFEYQMTLEWLRRTLAKLV